MKPKPKPREFEESMDNQIIRRGRAIVCIVNGKETTLHEIAASKGMSYSSIYQRLIVHSMSLEDALKLEPVFRSKDWFQHAQGCTCDRCLDLAKRVEHFESLGSPLTPILAPNEIDDHRWFKKEGEYIVQWEGAFYRMGELAKKAGLRESALRGRLLRRAWPLERAIATPRAVKRPMEHGTKYCYDYHKCRCPECRAINALYSRKYYVPKSPA